MVTDNTYKQTFILAIIYILVFTGCSRNPIKTIPYNDMDATLVEQTEKIYFELFKSCEQDSLNLFLNQVFITPKVYKALLAANNLDVCQFVEIELGEITAIDLTEALYFKDLRKLIRCKLNAIKLDEPIEFRMILNNANNLLEIGFYPWHDIYDKRIQEKGIERIKNI